MFRNNKYVVNGYKWFAIWLCFLAIVDPDLARWLISLGGYLIIKLFIAFNIFIWSDKIMAIGDWFVSKRIAKITQPKVDHVTVEWVPLVDLVGFCFAVWWFPVQDAINEFGISKKEHKKIGDKLEELGILTRWDNNARVVVENMEQEQILDKVASVVWWWDVEDVLVRTSETTIEKLHHSLHKALAN
jgi:hypothetical protein